MHTQSTSARPFRFLLAALILALMPIGMIGCEGEQGTTAPPAVTPVKPEDTQGKETAAKTVGGKKDLMEGIPKKAN